MQNNLHKCLAPIHDISKFTQTAAQLCAMPCLESSNTFVLPTPGASKRAFAFHLDGDRELFFIMPRNHPAHPKPSFNPKIMIVGLSPAGNQIQGFIDKYAETSDYDAAARWASFRGLEKDIVGMLRGLGVDRLLGLSLSNVTSFANHPDILTNSLVKCASLSQSGSSDDFAPKRYASNVRCITRRFYAEATHSQFTRLSHIFIFGDKAQRALRTIPMPNNQSVWDALIATGRTVVGLPHPSGQNGEYVNLAKLPQDQFPSQESYAELRWQKYVSESPRHGRLKKAEQKYKATRRRYWCEIDRLRKLFSAESA